MKKKSIDILNKIKTLVQKFEDMPQPVPVDPIILTTTDGVQVSIDKFEVGGNAMINGMPAPANTYTFADGSSITVDAAGMITVATPAPAPQQDATPAPQPQPAPAQAPQPQAQAAAPAKFSFTDEHKTAEGMDKLFAAFATGTPEERITNLEIVAKALMEYSFGWEIKKAKEANDQAAAIKVYTETLAPIQAQLSAQEKQIADQKALIIEMSAFIKEFSEESVTKEVPPTSKTNMSFGINKKKGIDKYAAIAAEVHKKKEEKANA